MAGIAPPYLPKAEVKHREKNQEASYKLSVEALQMDQKKSITPGTVGTALSLQAMRLCQALFIAAAYRLELKVDQIHEQVGFDD